MELMATRVNASFTFKQVFACGVALVALILCVDSDSAYGQAAVYIVRHAERLDISEDSPLSSQGLQRAEALAKLLKRANVRAIYTSHFQRTVKTAKPLATERHIQPVVINGGDPNETYTRIRAEHPKDVVLIVGHSNTVDPLIKKWDPQAEVSIGGDEYDAMFVIVPTGETAGWTRFKYAGNAP